MLQNYNISIDFDLLCVSIKAQKGDQLMNKLLGNRIRELRCARNYTQEQMADRIGVSRQKYARIENGTNSITLDILSKIASILDVTVGDITSVLDKEPAVAYRTGSEDVSAQKIFDMLDLFYANKHMYDKLHK